MTGTVKTSKVVIVNDESPFLVELIKSNGRQQTQRTAPHNARFDFCRMEMDTQIPLVASDNDEPRCVNIYECDEVCLLFCTLI